MNRFVVFSCLDFGEDDKSIYDGPVVGLANVADPTVMLFFPIDEQGAEVLNYIIDIDDRAEVEFDNNKVLSIYKTMLDSWMAGDRFLSGIYLDAAYDEEAEKDVPVIRLILSGQDGRIDSFVHVNFIHAIYLAVIEEMHIIISDKLYDMMVPLGDEDREGGNGNDPSCFPEDENIVDIARQIMSGKIQDK